MWRESHRITEADPGLRGLSEVNFSMPLPRAHTKSTALTLEDSHQVSQWDFGVFWVCCSLHFFSFNKETCII